jgi:hypothetical protein
MKKHLSAVLPLLVCCSACTTQLFAADPAPVVLPAQPFDLADVRLLDGPSKDAQERDKGYILRVEPERLMHWLRVNNGLPSKAQP